MNRQEFNKLNVYDKVKIVMNQPMSEMECRDQALRILESYHEDFGFDNMEYQVRQMANAYEYVAEEAGSDYGGVEMQKLIKEQGEALRYFEKEISKISNEYGERLMDMLRDFKLDFANIEENNGNTSDESMDSVETSNLNEAISGTPKMEKGKDYYGMSTKDGKKYLIKVLETTGVMGDCNVFFGETLIAKGYSMFVGGNFNTPSGVWAFKDPQMKSKYGDFKVTSTSNLNESIEKLKTDFKRFK